MPGGRYQLSAREKATGQQYGTYCNGSVQYVGYGFPRQVFTYYRNTVGGGHALFSLGSA